jgi:hypothetical protein
VSVATATYSTYGQVYTLHRPEDIDCGQLSLHKVVPDLPSRVLVWPVLLIPVLSAAQRRLLLAFHPRLLSPPLWVLRNHLAVG